MVGERQAVGGLERVGRRLDHRILCRTPGGMNIGVRQLHNEGSAQIGALAVVAGLAVGVLTSFGQRYLGGALDPLVNSASAWLVMPFVLGLVARTPGGAAAAGLTCCLLQLVGYDLTAHLRGYGVSASREVFWAVCAVIGGPAFGAAGWLSRRGHGRLRGLGPAVLAAAFLAEGVWNYLHELHYYGSAALWIGIGLVLVALTLRERRTALWLAVTLPAGLIAEIVLTRIYL